jgi:uncharacterized protein (DUF2062 family)
VVLAMQRFGNMVIHILDLDLNTPINHIYVYPFTWILGVNEIREVVGTTTSEYIIDVNRCTTRG